MSSRAALLVLADGRLPTGGYAHSAGLEQAIRQGWVNDIDELRDFLRGRLHTTGLMNASFTVAAWNALDEVDPTAATALRDLDAELLARTPSPALRRIGAWLGTLMLRSVRSIRPHPLLESFPQDLQQPIVYGAVGRALGLADIDTAATLLHESVTGPATAAVKLMHIDPFQAHGAIVDLAADLDAAAERAAAYGRGDPAEIPALSAPLSDFAAELHEGDNVRLFAS